MSTRKTNEAVEQFRRVVKSQRRFELDETNLNQRVEGLTAEEFADYMFKTQEIEAAVSVIPDTAPETVLRSALNGAGRDVA